ncbi:sigma 54-interacting transcriptional regulator [Clostridium sp. MSJ-11]|uniref:Sigma 54-interacting transcriptional regulator n=1 Tax=Clostridium mobile TaxID=2841512 RepID=A0ABS6EDB4_9CLOT|nr:sigma 54-interacting transcriptional regulator [Clostridium mobile]MBU5483180.1 sigma 54-interacting transcriptional regulator [Clostridium mobile]
MNKFNNIINDAENYKLIFEEILDMTEDGFVVTSTNGTILEINNAYCSFLETTKERAIGHHISEFIPNTKMPQIAEKGIKEVDMIHDLIGERTYKGDKFLFVTRAPVKKNGEVIAAVAQVKFRLHTMKLAQKLIKQDKEIKYYKDELQRLGESKFAFNKILGNSECFLETLKLAKKASSSTLSVLINGETGTGKEVFANAIHYASSRKDKPLITINCAAIPHELLESELFGYEEGSFTGAKRGGKKGKFQLANKGTIFLDEIGDMPLHMQAKLLRVLQENEIERVGGDKPIPIDVRVIAATHQDLRKLIKEKKFREDLYYRLNVINIKIPPLRQRKEDIDLFINSFLKKLNKKYKTNTIISQRARELLLSHRWPGNIRELKNVIESAYVIADKDVIGIKHLPSNLLTVDSSMVIDSNKNNLDLILKEFEKDIIIEALMENDYKISKVAKELGIHRTTLYKKLEKLDIKILKQIED